MKPRSKKYYLRKKEESGEKKGSVSDAGYNEENKITSRQSPKKNPAPPKSEEIPLPGTVTSGNDGDAVVEKESDPAG